MSRPAPPAALLVALVLALALPPAGAPAAAAVPGVDWTARPTEPLALPDGWTAVGCEGDAPLLCTAEGGRPQGVVEHLTWPLAGSDLAADLEGGTPLQVALVRELRRFQATVRADREQTCPGVAYVQDPTVGAVVGGLDGVRYGFSLLRDGQLVERVVGVMAVRGAGADAVVDVVAAEELAEGSCVSAEGTAPFVEGGLGRFTPILAQLVARSRFGHGGGAVPPPAEGVVDAEDAVATAVALAGLARPGGDPGGTVLIARDDAFADALASGGLQGALGAPLLLTGGGRLDDRAADELERLGTARAVLLGGEAALSAQVAADLGALGLAVERIAGEDRVATALAIADAAVAGGILREVDQVVLVRASGDPTSGDPAGPSRAYADALAAGALGAAHRVPVLLTAGEELDPRVAAWLQAARDQRGLEEVLVAGGEAAIGLPVRQAVVEIGLGIDPAVGADRAETAVQVAVRRGLPSAAHADGVVLVDGRDWVGGVTAALLAAETLAPVLLTAGDELPPATAAFLDAGPATVLRIAAPRG